MVCRPQPYFASTVAEPKQLFRLPRVALPIPRSYFCRIVFISTAPTSASCTRGLLRASWANWSSAGVRVSGNGAGK